MANIEHSIPLVCGKRVTAKDEGIEVRSEAEVIVLLTWAQIDHLRALIFDQR